MMRDATEMCAEDPEAIRSAVHAELRETPGSGNMDVGLNDVGARLRDEVGKKSDFFLAEACDALDGDHEEEYENHTFRMPTRTRALLQIRCLEGDLPEAFFNMRAASSDMDEDETSDATGEDHDTVNVSY